MKSQDLKDMQWILKHYLDITSKGKTKNDALRRIANNLSYLIEKELLKQ